MEEESEEEVEESDKWLVSKDRHMGLLDLPDIVQKEKRHMPSKERKRFQKGYDESIDISSIGDGSICFLLNNKSQLFN